MNSRQRRKQRRKDQLDRAHLLIYAAVARKNIEKIYAERGYGIDDKTFLPVKL